MRRYSRSVPMLFLNVRPSHDVLSRDFTMCQEDLLHAWSCATPMDLTTVLKRPLKVHRTTECPQFSLACVRSCLIYCSCNQPRFCGHRKLLWTYRMHVGCSGRPRSQRPDIRLPLQFLAFMEQKHCSRRIAPGIIKQLNEMEKDTARCQPDTSVCSLDAHRCTSKTPREHAALACVRREEALLPYLASPQMCAVHKALPGRC